MKLSNAQKILLGIVTCLPFILAPYIIYEIIQFIVGTIQQHQQGEEDPVIILNAILSFLIPILFLSFVSLFLLVIYIIHAVRNSSINDTERVIWILFFLFFGIITFPIYWFMRIWNGNDAQQL